ncbi:hypothetical protein [Streptacidiphilus sp. MAP12-20]|uniref:hypothetical protein n=1 Tax=Streptacidiphilus sp. MAP12-20 TaxID=3156299 RepID=UPI003516E9ED
MNPIKGAGAVLLVALIVILLTAVKDTGTVLLALSITILSTSLTTYAASLRRRRNDRRTAGL